MVKIVKFKYKLFHKHSLGAEMNTKIVITILLVFILGFLSSQTYDKFTEKNTKVVVDDLTQRNLLSRQQFTQFTLPNSPSDNSEKTMANYSRDKPSPKGRVKTDQIFVYDDEVILKIKNPQWAVFADSKSMDPVIDFDSKAIEVIPKTSDNIQVGDILAYESKIKNAVVAHRVVETGNDEQGWFARMKGDNNAYIDPEFVRFNQVKRVVVAVIY